MSEIIVSSYLLTNKVYLRTKKYLYFWEIEISFSEIRISGYPSPSQSFRKRQVNKTVAIRYQGNCPPDKLSAIMLIQTTVG